MNAKFIIGLDDHLFLNNDTNMVMSQTVGKIQIPDEVLARHFDFHSTISASLTSSGAHYLYLVAPNKETALRDLLPAEFHYEAEGPTPIKAFQRSFPESSAFLFFDENILCPQSVDFVTYDRGDTHWTQRGALAYLTAGFAFLKRIELQERLVAIRIAPVDNKAIGDLGKHAGRGFEDVEELKLLTPYSQILFEGPIVNEGYLRHVYCQKGCGRALIFHDSFTQALFPLLSEMFEQTLFVHAPDYISDLVHAFRPNYVIRIQAERFFPRSPVIIDDTVSWLKSIESEKGASDATSNYVTRILSRKEVVPPEKPVRLKIFFCHIPKNAGTSIATHLVSHYEWPEIFGLDEVRLNLKHLVDNQTGVVNTHNLISGHIPLPCIEGILHEFDLILAVVRPPIERLISQHRFWIDQSYVRRNITMQEFFTEIYVENLATRNEQCGYIGYSNDFQSVLARMESLPSLRLVPYHALDRLNSVAEEFHLRPFIIPRLNETSATIDPWHAIDTAFYQRVFEWFADDFLLYDYVVSLTNPKKK